MKTESWTDNFVQCNKVEIYSLAWNWMANAKEYSLLLTWTCNAYVMSPLHWTKIDCCNLNQNLLTVLELHKNFWVGMGEIF